VRAVAVRNNRDQDIILEIKPERRGFASPRCCRPRHHCWTMVQPRSSTAASAAAEGPCHRRLAGSPAYRSADRAASFARIGGRRVETRPLPEFGDKASACAGPAGIAPAGHDRRVFDGIEGSGRLACASRASLSAGSDWTVGLHRQQGRKALGWPGKGQHSSERQPETRHCAQCQQSGLFARDVLISATMDPRSRRREPPPSAHRPPANRHLAKAELPAPEAELRAYGCNRKPQHGEDRQGRVHKPANCRANRHPATPSFHVCHILDSPRFLSIR